MLDNEKLKKIEAIILMAENWCDKQILPEGSVCVSALKDIRRVVRIKKEIKIYE